MKDKQVINFGKTYNWKPVVGSLLSKLQKAGFTLVSVDNGGGKEKLEGTDREKRQQAKAEICAVEEAHLYVETGEGIRKWIFLVLGNEPHETVNDYAPDSGLEAVFEGFEKQWEGKSCPKY